jgi:hypothetical protein
MFKRAHHCGKNKEIQKNVDKPYEPFHALEITPHALRRVDTEYISHKENNTKEKCCYGERGFADVDAVRRVMQSKCHPTSKGYFDEYPKDEPVMKGKKNPDVPQLRISKAFPSAT